MLAPVESDSDDEEEHLRDPGENAAASKMPAKTLLPHELNLQFKMQLGHQEALCFPQGLDDQAGGIGHQIRSLLGIKREDCKLGYSYEHAALALDTSKSFPVPHKNIFLHSAYVTPCSKQLVPPNCTFVLSLRRWDASKNNYVPVPGSNHVNYVSGALTCQGSAGVIIESEDLRADGRISRDLVHSHGLRLEHLEENKGKKLTRIQWERLVNSSWPFLVLVVEVYLPDMIRGTIKDIREVAFSGLLSLRFLCR